MKFIWDGINTAHIARHGIRPWFAEKIYKEGLSSVSETDIEFRYIAEATIREKHYRLVFSSIRGGGIYVVTAFQIKKRKM